MPDTTNMLTEEDLRVIEEFNAQNPHIVKKLKSQATAIAGEIETRAPELVRMVRSLDDMDIIALKAVGCGSDEPTTIAHHVGIHIVIV